VGQAGAEIVRRHGHHAHVHVIGDRLGGGAGRRSQQEQCGERDPSEHAVYRPGEGIEW
jgi:hypothetical protein